MWHFQKLEHQRPEFNGILGKDPVTGKIKKTFKPNRWQRIRYMVSYSVVLLFVGLVIAMVAGILIYRGTTQNTWGLIFSSFLNAM